MGLSIRGATSRDAEGWDGMDEVVLTPRMVTSHQRIPLLFIARGDLPKGEHQGHHPGKIPSEKQSGGACSPLGMLQGIC